MPRSTQPSTLCGTVRWVSAYELSNNSNGDGGCGRQLPVFGGLTAQVDWLGLSVGGHPALSLHSSNEPGELSQWLWSWWQHHEHCRRIYRVLNAGENWRRVFREVAQQLSLQFAVVIAYFTCIGAANRSVVLRRRTTGSGWRDRCKQRCPTASLATNLSRATTNCQTSCRREILLKAKFHQTGRTRPCRRDAGLRQSPRTLSGRVRSGTCSGIWH